MVSVRRSVRIETCRRRQVRRREYPDAPGARYSLPRRAPKKNKGYRSPGGPAVDGRERTTTEAAAERKQEGDREGEAGDRTWAGGSGQATKSQADPLCPPVPGSAPHYMPVTNAGEVSGCGGVGGPRKAQVTEEPQDRALRGGQGVKPMGGTKGLEGTLRPAVGTSGGRRKAGPEEPAGRAVDVWQSVATVQVSGGAARKAASAGGRRVACASAEGRRLRNRLTCRRERASADALSVPRTGETRRAKE